MESGSSLCEYVGLKGMCGYKATMHIVRVIGAGNGEWALCLEHYIHHFLSPEFEAYTMQYKPTMGGSK